MMKWVMWLSLMTILLTAADGVVHIVEWTTTGDLLWRLSSGASGIAELRETLAAQTVWMAVSAWIVVSQIGIVWIASRFRERK
jgi:hypothetical protein